MGITMEAIVPFVLEAKGVCLVVGGGMVCGGWVGGGDRFRFGFGCRLLAYLFGGDVATAILNERLGCRLIRFLSQCLPSGARFTNVFLILCVIVFETIHQIQRLPPHRSRRSFTPQLMICLQVLLLIQA